MNDPEEIDEEPVSADICDVGKAVEVGEVGVRTNFDCESSITDPLSGSVILCTVTSFVNHFGRSSRSSSEGGAHFCIVSSNARRRMISVYDAFRNPLVEL